MIRTVGQKLGGAAILAMVMAGGALAQGAQKELSEHSVKVLMGYAWQILPSKFTAPSGKTILVDKQNKYDETIIPVDVARDVVKVGYLTAQAQLCELWEEQVANYDTMMLKEMSKKTWNDQQLLYITTLHRMTIHMAAGKLTVTEKDGEPQVKLDAIEPSKDTCNDEKKAKVKEAIAAYVKQVEASVPRPAAAPAAPAASSSKAPSQPVPAAQKK